MDHAVLRVEATDLKTELDNLPTNANKWQFRKGMRLRELGYLLQEAVFIEKGERFLNDIGFPYK